MTGRETDVWLTDSGNASLSPAGPLLTCIRCGVLVAIDIPFSVDHHSGLAVHDTCVALGQGSGGGA